MHCSAGGGEQKAREVFERQISFIIRFGFFLKNPFGLPDDVRAVALTKTGQKHDLIK